MGDALDRDDPQLEDVVDIVGARSKLHAQRQQAGREVGNVVADQRRVIIAGGGRLQARAVERHLGVAAVPRAHPARR